MAVEVDGIDATGPITVPNTGGWQLRTTIRKPGIIRLLEQDV